MKKSEKLIRQPADKRKINFKYFLLAHILTLFFVVAPASLTGGSNALAADLSAEEADNFFNFNPKNDYSEPFSKLIEFLNDKKNELEKYNGDFLSAKSLLIDTGLRASKSGVDEAAFNPNISSFLSAVFESVKSFIVDKPSLYFGTVIDSAKSFVFPGTSQNDFEYKSSSEEEMAREIEILKQQYAEAIDETNTISQKFNLLQSELGKIKNSGAVVRQLSPENRTVENTIKILETIVSGLPVGQTSEAVFPSSDMDSKISEIRTELNNLNASLTSQINSLSSNTNRQTASAFQAISLTNRIDNLSGTRLSNITVSGVSGLADADIPDTITASNYLPLSGGTLTGALTGTSASFSSTLTVSASTTLNGVEYKWPSADGTVNQALVTNGAGGLSWTTISGGGASPDWNKQTNYGALALTASTTIPYWAKDAFYASSTSVFQGLATFGNASTSQISATNSYLGTVLTGVWNGTALTDAYISSATAWNNKWDLASSTIPVNKGGTGQISFGQGWLHSDGTTFTSSTSPTVAYLTATSTTATSTFANLAVATQLKIGSDYLIDITGANLSITNGVLNASGGAADFTFEINYGGTAAATSSSVWLKNPLYASSTSIFQGLATFGNATATQLTLTNLYIGGDQLDELCGTGLTCSSNTLALNATGDWTGTLDTYNGSDLLARANHTGTQNLSTISNYDWVFSNNYGTSNLTASSSSIALWARGGINASSTSNFVYASTTALTVSGNSYLGTISSGTWNGSILSPTYGGTGWAAIQSGTIPYGNGSSALSTTTAGTAGNVLALLNGVPTWTATTSLSDIGGTLAVAKGGTGQTSFGQGWLHSDGTTFTSSTSPTVAYITATSTTATSTFQDLGFGSNSNWFQRGQRFLTSSTTAAGNLTIGYQSATGLDANGGLYNTAVGYQVLGNATSTSYNTALGYQALLGSATISNTGSNTAVGYQSLFSNTTGYYNTANGYHSLLANTTGYQNTANGFRSLYSNTTGTFNAANGADSLFNNTTGYYNTANGVQSLFSLAGGYHNNTALGFNAGRYQADGVTALATPSQSVYIGSGAMGFDNSDINSIVIGYLAKGIGANSVVLGNDSITTTALKGNVGIGTTSPYSKLSVAGQTVAEYFTATSTTATSTFPYLNITTQLKLGSDYITDITGANLSITDGVLSASGSGASPDWNKQTNYGALALTASTTIPYWAKDAFYASSTSVFQGLATFGNASTSQISATNSYLGTVLTGTWNGTAIGDAYLTKSGDWTGTLDTYNGSDLLSRANHTGTQGVSTISNYDWTFLNNYGAINLTASSTKPLWAQGGLNASSTSNFVYASTTALTVSGGAWFTGGNIGIGTTSPYAKLSVSGDTALDSMFINFASSTASSLTLNYLKSATSTIPSNTNYAWSIATSTTASPIFSISTLGSGANMNATTTINGGLNLDNGALLYDYSSGITSINSLEAGPMSFDNDAGIVTAFDLPIVSAATGTVESYGFNIAASSTPNLTIYGEAIWQGVKNQRVGVGTSTPWKTFSVFGTVGFSSSLSATTTNANDVCIDVVTFEITRRTTDCSGASSLRYKQNVEKLSYGLEDLMKLNPVSFQYTEAFAPTDRARKIGFIAEEVALLIPEVVAYDDLGRPDSLDYPKFTSLLAKAIQELNLKVSDLEANITAASSTNSSEPSSGLFSWIVNKFMTTLGIVFEQDRIKAKNICVGETCVTEDQFKAVFGSPAQAGSSQSALSSFSSSSSSSLSSLSAGQADSSESSSQSSQEAASSSSSNFSESSSNSSADEAGSSSTESSSNSSSLEAVSSSEASSGTASSSSATSETLSSQSSASSEASSQAESSSAAGQSSASIENSN